MTTEQHDRVPVVQCITFDPEGGTVTLPDAPTVDPALTTSGPTPPGCTACGGPAAIHWQRRLTPDEITDEQAKEQARRDRAIALADPQLPPPEFGPLPDCADYTRAIYGCLQHYITRDAAALIHQATCTAPDPAVLPACNCTPEPAPGPGPAPQPAPLPPGW